MVVNVYKEYRKTLLFKVLTLATSVFLLISLGGCNRAKAKTNSQKQSFAVQANLPLPNFVPKLAKKANSPKSEPMSAYGNTSYYHVKGKRYDVIADATKYDKVGIASWYGKDFDGKLTANREIFHMNGLTAASRTLPLPTYVKVTNLSNNKSIVVRVNDRGPYKLSRIIDLSYGAAKKLGFVEAGTTKVHITAVSAPNIANGTHYLQVASFSKKNHAEKFKKILATYTDKPIRIRQYKKTTKKNYYRIEVGPYSSADKLHIAQAKFKKNGFPHTIAIVG